MAFNWKWLMTVWPWNISIYMYGRPAQHPQKTHPFKERLIKRRNWKLIGRKQTLFHNAWMDRWWKDMMRPIAVIINQILSRKAQKFRGFYGIRNKDCPLISIRNIFEFINLACHNTHITLHSPAFAVPLNSCLVHYNVNRRWIYNTMHSTLHFIY